MAVATAVGAGVALAALALGLPAALAWGFTHPPRRRHRRTPRAVGLVFERVRLRARDGVRLSAWYVPPPPVPVTPRGVIIVCHGYWGNRAEMLPHACFLHHAGYAVLLLDFRAHGWSGGRMATFGLTETLDVQAALDWVEDHPDLAGLPLALLGESMGASVSLLTAAQDPRVRAVVSDAAFARFDSAVAARLRLLFGRLAEPVIAPTRSVGERLLGVRSTDIAPEDAIAGIAPRPVFLIHGLEDRLLVPEHSRRLLRAAAPGGHATLWEVAGAGHVASIRVAPDEYARRVLAFLNDALAGPE